MSIDPVLTTCIEMAEPKDWLTHEGEGYFPGKGVENDHFKFQRGIIQGIPVFVLEFHELTRDFPPTAAGRQRVIECLANLQSFVFYQSAGLPVTRDAFWGEIELVALRLTPNDDETLVQRMHLPARITWHNRGPLMTWIDRTASMHEVPAALVSALAVAIRYKADRPSLKRAFFEEGLRTSSAKTTAVQAEEAAKLRELWDATPNRITQAEFGQKYNLGSQGNIGHYLSGRNVLNIEAALAFAKELNCELSAFSPRLHAAFHDRMSADVVGEPPVVDRQIVHFWFSREGAIMRFHADGAWSFSADGDDAEFSTDMSTDRMAEALAQFAPSSQLIQARGEEIPGDPTLSLYERLFGKQNQHFYMPHPMYYPGYPYAPPPMVSPYGPIGSPGVWQQPHVGTPAQPWQHAHAGGPAPSEFYANPRGAAAPAPRAPDQPRSTELRAAIQHYANEFTAIAKTQPTHPAPEWVAKQNQLFYGGFAKEVVLKFRPTDGDWTNYMLVVDSNIQSGSHINMHVYLNNPPSDLVELCLSFVGAALDINRQGVQHLNIKLHVKDSDGRLQLDVPQTAVAKAKEMFADLPIQVTMDANMD